MFSFEKPDFLKRREQKKFEKLPPEKKEEIIAGAQDEALKVEIERMRETVRSGKKLGEKEALFLVRHNNVRGLTSLIDGFENLSPEIARFLVKNKEFMAVINHPEKFGITIDNHWLKLIIENGGIDIIARKSKKLGIILDESWARFVIKHRGKRELFSCLAVFGNISEEFANELFELIEGGKEARTMLASKEAFDFVFDNSWAKKMVDKGYLRPVTDYIEVFRGISGEIADIIIKEAGLEFFIDSEDSFSLSKEYYTSVEFRQLMFNEIKASIAQGKIRYLGKILSCRYTSLSREMREELHSP